MMSEHRPRYRVLAAPWYDHEGNQSPDHPDGAGHDSFCAAGYALEVFIVNPGVPGLDDWRSIGATQTDSGGTLDLREVKETVIDYVQALAHPRPVNPDPARIEVFVRVDQR